MASVSGCDSREPGRQCADVFGFARRGGRMAAVTRARDRVLGCCDGHHRSRLSGKNCPNFGRDRILAAPSCAAGRSCAKAAVKTLLCRAGSCGGMVVNGQQPVYRSDFIVARDSRFRSLQDVFGHRFAFNALDSHFPGYNAPQRAPGGVRVARAVVSGTGGAVRDAHARCRGGRGRCRRCRGDRFVFAHVDAPARGRIWRRHQCAGCRRDGSVPDPRRSLPAWPWR